jgi:hypothetical protein
MLDALDRINSKFQDPNSKPIPSSKFQTRNEFIGIWLLEFGISPKGLCLSEFGI